LTDPTQEVLLLTTLRSLCNSRRMVLLSDLLANCDLPDTDALAILERLNVSNEVMLICDTLLGQQYIWLTRKGLAASKRVVRQHQA
jgi:hypothetical protein